MSCILVIDDDAQVRAIIREVLEQQGHEVAEAPDGAVGMRMLRETPPDLVITNIFMPEQEGIETIMQLRGDDADLPIIAISGGGTAGGFDVLESASILGATQTLRKPFDVDVLADTVARLLAGKS